MRACDGSSVQVPARELVGCAVEMRMLRVILLRVANADRTGTHGLAAAVACGATARRDGAAYWGVRARVRVNQHVDVFSRSFLVFSRQFFGPFGAPLQPR